MSLVTSSLLQAVGVCDTGLLWVGVTLRRGRARGTRSEGLGVPALEAL